MNYITGKTIKSLREQKKLTQSQLAEIINVTDKAVSKWETDRGLPDISIIGDLAKALGVSITELLTGDIQKNSNKKADLTKSHLYVCPICQNIITSSGESTISCCGITLPPLEPDEPLDDTEFKIEKSDGQFYVHSDTPMQKNNYISFFACVTQDSIQIKKFYPEQTPEARFNINGQSTFYAYSTRLGLLKINS